MPPPPPAIEDHKFGFTEHSSASSDHDFASSDDNLVSSDHSFVAVSAHSRSRIFCCASARMVMHIVGRQVAFHVANAALGFGGGLAVVLGVVLALLLMPVAGIAATHALLTAIATSLCRLDVVVHNLIVDRTVDQIAFPSRHELAVWDGTEPAKRHLASPPSPLLAVVYFGVVRVVLAVLSSLSLALLVLFTVAFSHDHLNVQITDRAGEKLEIGAWIYIECLAGAMVSSCGLHALGRLAQATTRMFCCEQRPY